MNQQQRSVVQQALEALEKNHYYMIDAGLPNQSMLNTNFAAVIALRQMLEQQEQGEVVVKSNGHVSPLLTHMMNRRTKAEAQPVQEPVACLSETQAKAILNLALHLETTGRCVAITEGQERADFVAINQNTQYALEDALRNATTPPAAQPAVPLTDEQIRHYADSRAFYGSSNTEYREGIVEGAKWAREQLTATPIQGETK